MCATSFIVSVVQHLKIGDLTIYPSRIPSPSDEDAIGTDQADGQDSDLGPPRLSKAEERSLARDSTAGFTGNVGVSSYRLMAKFNK